jgi:hypothetical protein
MPVSKTAKNSLLALWESGAPLDSAWIEFHPFLDSFAIRALRTHPANDPDVLAGNPRYKELCKGWLPRTWESRQKKLAATSKSGRVHLLGEIYAGNLSAIGFRTRADGSDELVPVPRQFFFFDEAGEREQRPDIHWGKGELTAGATSYFHIRVVRAPVEVKQLPAPPSAAKAAGAGRRIKVTRPKSKAKNHREPSRRKNVGGRRKTRPDIIRAFRKLWKTKPTFRTLRVKEMVPEVRAEILGENARHEERSGYRSSSMAKTIGHELSVIRKQKFRNKPKEPKPN